jgi:hypothetical protein
MSVSFLRWPYRMLALGLDGGTPLAALACATFGCTLSADGAMGYAVNSRDNDRSGLEPAPVWLRAAAGLQRP